MIRRWLTGGPAATLLATSWRLANPRVTSNHWYEVRWHVRGTVQVYEVQFEVRQPRQSLVQEDSWEIAYTRSPLANYKTTPRSSNMSG
ncbi:hypothetical protein Tco_0225775 [Tanacetum coccineum]